MPEFTTPTSNTFCWADLQTTDPAAGRAFYSKLLGWSIADMPGSVPYSVASVDGSKMVAGIMELPARAKTMGAPSHWLPYVAVDDVPGTAGRAKSLGAVLLVEPTRMGPGMFSVIRDPQGAVFAIWRADQSMGTTLVGEPGSVGWNELITPDVDASRAFYTSLFGWKAEAFPMPDMTYTVFQLGDQGVGGMAPVPEGHSQDTAAWSVYFVVPDPDAAFALAHALGAKTAMPLMDVPTVGRMGFLLDPQGAVFAVIRFEARAA